MDVLVQEIVSLLPSAEQFARVSVRLIAAALFGAIAGIDREKAGKPAGLRTHMLVALGSAVFVMAPIELGVPVAEAGRVVQGIAAGIGFIGAGAILKRAELSDVQGLTTAASIWLTSAVGAAIGMGGLAVAVLASLLTWIILSVLGRVETWRSQ